ncbi:MAG: hypothetical protein ACT4PL_06440 [Phycisphaerales bacterium]
MNNLTEWIKTHWVIVVSVAVMLLVPPAMVYFAQRMSAGLVKGVQTQVDADVAELNGAKNINYSIPSPVAGGPPTEYKGPPNQKLIEFFEAKRKSQADQLAQIGTVALAFNQSSRTPLVEGVFPDSETNTIRKLEFQTHYIRTAYPALLKRLKIGVAPDPTELVPEFTQKRAEVVTRLTGTNFDPAQTVPDAVLEQYNAEMKRYRINRYKQHAATIAMFIEPDAAFLLPVEQNIAPDMTVLWDWQWQYWIREDILTAAVRASRDVADQGVPGAVVKRVDGMRIEAIRAFSGDGSPLAEFNTAVPLKPEVSLSGRLAGPGTGNGMYDIRNVTLKAIVSLNNLPRFVDALAETNFMTVLDIDFTEVPVYDELKLGFYFGDEPVVAATFTIETVWFRQWTKKWMPPVMRLQQGIPEDAPVDPSAAPAGGTPPPNG